MITAKRENPGNYQCWDGRCQYTSARINTAGKFTQTYGRFEARMKMPRGKGIWPAFWMLGADINTGNPWPGSGEIDIMEFLGHQQNTAYGTIHGPGYSGSGGLLHQYNGPNFADGFHNFAVDWRPGEIVWSVDGNVYGRKTPADLGGRQWVFNKPFFIIINLAVGGEWPGYPDGSTTFPQQLVIDWVRVSNDSPPPVGGARRSAASAASASTWPGRAPPTARPSRSPTATATTPRSGAVPVTARSARWASAWTSPAAVLRTGQRSSCGTATVPARSGGPSAALRTS